GVAGIRIQHRYWSLDRLRVERVYRRMAGFLGYRHCFLGPATETKSERGIGQPFRESPACRGINAKVAACVAYHPIHGASIAAFLLFRCLVARGAAGLGNGVRNIGMGAVVYPVYPIAHRLYRPDHRRADEGSYAAGMVYRWHIGTEYIADYRLAYAVHHPGGDPVWLGHWIGFQPGHDVVCSPHADHPGSRPHFGHGTVFRLCSCCRRATALRGTI